MKVLCASSLMLVVSLLAFADEPATHGMLLFGKNANYVSHLPMFHAPHDYQLLAEVTLAEKGSGTTLDKYERLKASNMIFTIVPKPMDLSKVLSGEISNFEVTIFKGHFERGGTPIGTALVTIKKILKGEKLHKEKGASRDFLSFGKAGEYYVAHLIAGQPTYDALYSSAAPAKLYFPPCGRGECREPVLVPVPDSNLPLSLTADELYGTTHPHNVTIGSDVGPRVVVKNPFYVEYNELAH